MKHFAGLSLLLLILSAPASAGTPSYHLFFELGGPFDGQCGALKQSDDFKVTPAMQDELAQRLPYFQALWDREGGALIRTMAQLLKHPYGRREESITLTLCQWFSPMS